MPAAKHILARRHGQAAAHPTTCFRCRASALGSEQLFHMRHGVLALVHTGERVLNSIHSHLTDTYPVAFRHDTQCGRRRRLKPELRRYHALNDRAGASRTSEAECRYRHLPCSDVLDETTSCIPLRLRFGSSITTDVLSAISLTNETNLRRQMPAICRMSIYCLTKELKSYSGLWGRVLQCGGGYAGFACNCGEAYTPKRDMSMRIGCGVCIPRAACVGNSLQSFPVRRRSWC